MDSLYFSMDYLNIEMACNWLRRLIEHHDPIPEKMLMSLCDDHAIPVFIECDSLEGFIAPWIGNSVVVRIVMGVEACRVMSPSQALDAFEPNGNQAIEVSGLAIVTPNQENPEPLYINHWYLTDQANRPFLFEPKSIKQLADTLIEQARAEKNMLPGLPIRHIQISQKRLDIIRQWFKEQTEYKAGNLRKYKPGTPGARDACWCWLVDKGFTAPGGLFSGCLKKGTGKSKSFDSAWSHFLKET